MANEKKDTKKSQVDTQEAEEIKAEAPKAEKTKSEATKGETTKDTKAAKKDTKELETLKKTLEKTSQELEAAKAALTKEKDDYIRLMAEFETFRRRSAEDRLSLVKSAAVDTIKGLLTVLDDCERAMSILEQSSDEAAKEGTSLIYNKLMEYLKSKGLEKIEAKGQDFDTDYHEAVTQFPAPDESLKGKVIDVIQTGYTLDGKVIRYAKVVVGA